MSSLRTEDATELKAFHQLSDCSMAQVTLASAKRQFPNIIDHRNMPGIVVGIAVVLGKVS